MKANQFSTIPIFLFLLAFIPLTCIALDLKIGDLQEFEGTIVQRDWSKSMGSYCAGGSKHFGLQVDDDKRAYTLNSARDPIHAEDRGQSREEIQSRLLRLDGKQVLVKGRKVTGRFEQSEHCCDGCQCPVTDIGPDEFDIDGKKIKVDKRLACSWIRIEEIRGVVGTHKKQAQRSYPSTSSG